MFWKELEEKMYDPKDPYGNKDHLPAAKALQSVDTVIRHVGQSTETFTAGELFY